MRAVLQRISWATVTVAGKLVAAIGVSGLPLGDTGQGLLALVGATHDDTAQTAEALARKVAGLRILDGQTSVAATGSPVLVVSQFTLYADTTRGRRPSWGAAAPGPAAQPLIDAVADALRQQGVRVASGVFGAHMHVELCNDGPVTVILDVP